MSSSGMKTSATAIKTSANSTDTKQSQIFSVLVPVAKNSNKSRAGWNIENLRSNYDSDDSINGE